MKKVNLQITGYGEEITIGKITTEQADYILQNHSLDFEVDLSETEKEQWFDIDDVLHTWGVRRDYGTMNLEVEEYNGISEYNDYDDLNAEPFDELSFSDFILNKNECYLISVATEKGEFFSIEFNVDFDIDMLELKVDYIEELDTEIVSGVIYNGEELDNNGGATDGKSFEQYIYMNGELIVIEEK